MKRGLWTDNALARVGVTRSESGPTTLVGYAAVYYVEGDARTEYRLWDTAVERIARGAFDGILADTTVDVRALRNHDPDRILGRRSAGTLRLSSDDVGLRYEIDLAETTAGRDTATDVESRNITGSSFWFGNGRTTITEREDGTTVYLRESFTELYDVGPVTFPAYEGTSVLTRSGEGDVSEMKAEWDRRRRAAEAERVRVVTAAAEAA
ncbi:MAG: HK97 family phage prohead protease [Planctomycetota bacterium]